MLSTTSHLYEMHKSFMCMETMYILALYLYSKLVTHFCCTIAMPPYSSIHMRDCKFSTIEQFIEYTYLLDVCMLIQN